MKGQTANRTVVRALFIVTVVLSLLFFRRVDASAAELTNIKLPANGGSKTIKRDINGDGKKESIKIGVTRLNGYYYNSVKVYINGKKVLNKSIKGCSGVSVNYVSCSAKKNYLQVTGWMDGEYLHTNKIYFISMNKLTEAADLGQADNASMVITKVTSKSVTVRFSVQPWETGRIRWNFVYEPSGKKLKLKSSTAKAYSELGGFALNDGYGKYFKKNQFRVAKSRTFYTSSSLKKKAFQAKKGDILTLDKVKISGKNMYLSFKKNGKTGWCRLQKNYSVNGFWFYGVSNRLAG